MEPNPKPKRFKTDNLISYKFQGARAARGLGSHEDGVGLVLRPSARTRTPPCATLSQSTAHAQGAGAAAEASACSLQGGDRHLPASGRHP